MLQAGMSRVRDPMSLNVFNLPNSSIRTLALGFTQPLTEKSTRNLPLRRARPALKAVNLTASSLENVGAPTYYNPIGLHGLLQG
jgi:hypothetical protein